MGEARWMVERGLSTRWAQCQHYTFFDGEKTG